MASCCAESVDLRPLDCPSKTSNYSEWPLDDEPLSKIYVTNDRYMHSRFRLQSAWRLSQAATMVVIPRVHAEDVTLAVLLQR